MPKQIQYLSPSAISLFYQDPKAYYMQYVCEESPPRPPQTLPMSAGSAFDAYVKSYLHDKLYGGSHPDAPKFELNALLEAQVDKNLLDTARPVGQYLFEQYKKSGALSDLMLELSSAITEPRFELEVKGTVSGYREGVTREVEGLVLLGKPDLFYINKYGQHVILDWKCSGFYSKYNISPLPGYMKLRRPGQVVPDRFVTESHHKDCVPKLHNGILINSAKHLEDYQPDWARQLTIYSWLLGVEPGSDFITAIDQIACDGRKRISYQGKYDYPEVRIAEHRLRVSSDYQFQILGQAQTVWETVKSDHFFRGMSKEESHAQCKLLDQMARSMNSKNISEEDQWLLNVSRK